MVDYLADLGRRIALLRQKRAITQEALSELTDLDRTYISQIERGLANPSLEVLMRIASALGVSICFLLCPKESEGEEL